MKEGTRIVHKVTLCHGTITGIDYRGDVAAVAYDNGTCNTALVRNLSPETS